MGLSSVLTATFAELSTHEQTHLVEAAGALPGRGKCSRLDKLAALPQHLHLSSSPRQSGRVRLDIWDGREFRPRQ